MVLSSIHNKSKTIPGEAPLPPAEHKKVVKRMKFGEKLRNSRIKNGLTQEELSLQLGVTCRTLQNYESGSVYPKKRELYTTLAKFFDTDVNYWLSESQTVSDSEKSIRHKGIQSLTAQVSHMFEDNTLTEEELDEFMRTIQSAYWAAKDKNKRIK